MNFTFGGSSGSSTRKKVSLGGSKTLTREEILENARREREKNKQSKLEEQSGSLLVRVARKFLNSRKEKNRQRLAYDELVQQYMKSGGGGGGGGMDMKKFSLLLNKLLYFYNPKRDEKDFNRLLIVLNFLIRTIRNCSSIISEDESLFKYSKLAGMVLNFIGNIDSNELDLTLNKRLILASQSLTCILDRKYYVNDLAFTSLLKKIICPTTTTHESSVYSITSIIHQFVTHNEEKSKTYAATLLGLVLSGSVNDPQLSLSFLLDLFSLPFIFTHFSRGSLLQIDIDSIFSTLKTDDVIENFKSEDRDSKKRLYFCGNFIEFSHGFIKDNKLSNTSIIKYLRIISAILPQVNFELISINESITSDESEESHSTLSDIRQQVELLMKRVHLKRIIEAMLSVTNENKESLVDFSNIFLFLMHDESKHTATILNIISYCSDDFHLVKTMWNAVKSDLLENIEILALFCKVYDNIITFMDDESFKTKPFSLEENVQISQALIPLCFELVWNNSKLTLKASLCDLLTKLHNRDVRLNFCPKNHFTISEASNLDIEKISEFIYRGDEMIDDDQTSPMMMNGEYIPLRLQRIQALKEAMTRKTSSFREIQAFNKTRELIEKLPFLVPLEIRLKIFKKVIELDREYSYDLQHFIEPIGIRREQIFEDSYTKLNTLSPLQFKGRVRVQFIDQHNTVEDGIGLGPLREYLFELSKLAFSNSYGLFKATDDGNLYPNPNSSIIYPDGLDLRFYNFLGKVLGKAIYDAIVIDLPFAKFFVSKLMKGNNNDLINDLTTLDKELHRNLLFLKNNSNAGDLGLNFTVVDGDELSGRVVRQLIPNGENILVNDSNKLSFIFRVANYKLNHQIKSQSDAFLKGLNEIVPSSWISLFDENEFIDIICGSDSPIDIDDLYANTEYGNGYNQENATIQMFWDVVFNDLTSSQHVLLLKFISSISRPPLLGFKDMHPKICIQRVNDTSRLPTSSTCYSLLKLPCYRDRETLKEKLIQAIEQGTQSFGLT